MKLNQAQLAQYHQDGFLLLEGLYRPDEVQVMKEGIRQVLATRNDPVTGGKTAEHGVFVGVSIHRPEVRTFHKDPRIVEPLRQIIGENIEFWSDKAVFKSGSVRFGSPWHQDWQYWKGAHKFSVWIALDDATEENGCLMFMPGSHHRIFDHGNKVNDGNGFNNRLDASALDLTQARVCAVNAGGAVIFHDLALHASLENHSGKDRMALITTYRDASKEDLHYDFAKAACMVSGVRTGLQAPTEPVAV